MEVRAVDWSSIPKSERIDILQAIPVGEYVKDLPYKSADSGLRRIRIPLYGVTEPVGKDGNLATADLPPYLEFEIVIVRDKDNNSIPVWKKVT